MSELTPEARAVADVLLDDVIHFECKPFEDELITRCLFSYKMNDLSSFTRARRLIASAYCATIVKSGMHIQPNGTRRYIKPTSTVGELYADVEIPLTGLQLWKPTIAGACASGSEKQIPLYKPGDQVVVLDSILNAEQVTNAACRFEDLGIITYGVVALLDAQNGNYSELFDKYGYVVRAILTLSGLAQYACKNNRAGITPKMLNNLLENISQKEYAMIKNYE